MMRCKHVFLCVLLYSIVHAGTAPVVDLATIGGEHKIVLSTKQIILPAYPRAFNPSIIPFQEGYLLTFRYCPDLYGNPWTSYIGVVLLNDAFEVAGAPQLLSTRSKGAKTPSHSEDARIFHYRGKMFLIYNDNIEQPFLTMQDRRDMFVAELSYHNREFTLSPPIKLIYLDKYYSALWQKNWVPFEWNQDLFITYTLNPHEIITPNFLHSECYLSHRTETPLQWDWGSLKLSCPPLEVDGEYLSFFHSWKVIATTASPDTEAYHYFIGAYTFSAKPPFALTKYTPLPIVDEKFYIPTFFYKRVIFPGGFVVKDKYIYLAYGKDDSEIWIATLDKEALQKALVPISVPAQGE